MRGVGSITAYENGARCQPDDSAASPRAPGDEGGSHGCAQTGNVRNVVLVGQGGVGKTSLAEAMLHLSGKTARFGGHAGTKPTLDYDAEEVKREFSISTSIAPIDWKDVRINVLDAPCYPDFIGDAYAAMSVCETALFVVSAAEGPQPTTVKLGTPPRTCAWRARCSSIASTRKTRTTTPA